MVHDNYKSDVNISPMIIVVVTKHNPDNFIDKSMESPWPECYFWHRSNKCCYGCDHKNRKLIGKFAKHSTEMKQFKSTWLFDSRSMMHFRWFPFHSTMHLLVCHMCVLSNVLYTMFGLYTAIINPPKRIWLRGSDDGILMVIHTGAETSSTAILCPNNLQ